MIWFLKSIWAQIRAILILPTILELSILLAVCWTLHRAQVARRSQELYVYAIRIYIKDNTPDANASIQPKYNNLICLFF